MVLINKSFRAMCLSFTTLIFLLSGCVSAKSITKGFNGVWIIKDYSLANISAWSDSKANSYIGSELTIANDDLSFIAFGKKYEDSLNDKGVKVIAGNLKNDPMVDPIKKGWVKPGKMGLSKDQNIIKIHLNLPFAGLIFLEKDQKVIVVWDGAAFLLKKVKSVGVY
jgi:hypothetical protein